jgi:hypothetical protein
MAETAAKDESRSTYLWTLALFAVVAAALVVWFQRHLQPFVTETLIIGGTISLWGLWKLVWTMFTDAGGENRKDLTRRLLGTPGAFSALLFLAVIAIVLHALTSSIYLRPAGAASGEHSFTVQVMEGDEVYMGPFTVKPGEVIGEPLFPSLGTHELEYQILEPRGFEPLRKTLRPWSAHNIKVPGSFARKVFHHVVLVPDTALFSDLPPPGVEGGPRYYVAITANGESAVHADFLQQLVVTGGAKQDLPASDPVKKDDGIREELSDHFGADPHVPPQLVIGTLLKADVASLPSVELGGGVPIVVEVGKWKTEGDQRIRAMEFSCKLTTPRSGGLHSLFIGPTIKECT